MKEALRNQVDQVTQPADLSQTLSWLSWNWHDETWMDCPCWQRWRLHMVPEAWTPSYQGRSNCYCLWLFNPPEAETNIKSSRWLHSLRSPMSHSNRGVPVAPFTEIDNINALPSCRACTNISVSELVVCLVHAWNLTQHSGDSLHSKWNCELGPWLWNSLDMARVASIRSCQADRILVWPSETQLSTQPRGNTLQEWNIIL